MKPVDVDGYYLEPKEIHFIRCPISIKIANKIISTNYRWITISRNGPRQIKTSEQNSIKAVIYDVREECQFHNNEE